MRGFSGDTSRRLGWLAAAAVAFLAILSGNRKAFAVARTEDLYSSNVVTLTSSNWKEEWEKLAASVKGMVTIAYWDTQGGSRPPRLLGDYQGTPTIRLFRPKRKPRTPGSVSEKTILDYQHGERTAADISKFLEYQLPNYAERVKFGKEDYDRLAAKAKRFGLPLVVVFTTKAKTSSTIKWLSAEYRRKILLIEVPPTDKNQGLQQEIFGRQGGDSATLYVVKPDGTTLPYEGESFARRKLQDFLKPHARKEPALEPLATETPNHDEF